MMAGVELYHLQEITTLVTFREVFDSLPGKAEVLVFAFHRWERKFYLGESRREYPPKIYNNDQRPRTQHIVYFVHLLALSTPMHHLWLEASWSYGAGFLWEFVGFDLS